LLEPLWFGITIRRGSRLPVNREVPIEADVQMLEMLYQRLDAFKVLGAARTHVLKPDLQAVAFASQAQDVM
jgi:hypothetical protein